MVNTLDSGLSSLALSIGQGHRIELLSKIVYSQYLSPPRCIMGTGKFNAGDNLVMD